MRHLMTVLAATAALVTSLSATTTPAAACAGLIGSNGAVNLGRTTTLAAYHEGIEHYVTAFQFLGGGGQFGTLIPLPSIPSSVERGGAWTLQRLARETEPPRTLLRALAATAAEDFAQVILQTRVDSRNFRHTPEALLAALGGSSTSGSLAVFHTTHRWASTPGSSSQQ